MDGFYRYDYAGGGGQGAGGLAFSGGTVAGLDIGGMVYRGTYRDNGAGGIAGSVTVSNETVEAGTLVTGAPMPAGASFEVPFDVPAEAAEGQVLRLATPTGTVSVKLTKIAAF